MSQEINLLGILKQKRSPHSVVARRMTPTGREESVTWDHFQCSVATLQDRCKSLPPGPVALITEDPCLFVVGLFALWHSGRVACCPPNANTETLASLEKQVVATFSDEAVAVPGHPRVRLEIEPGSSGSLLNSLEVLHPEQSGLQLFTSGTTGRGKTVFKKLRHLNRELCALDAQWGTALGDASIVGSASHQHLYGMLFRVLWPLCAGRVFDARTLLHAEELERALSQYGPCVFVSAPAHLKRLAERSGFARWAQSLALVFSSGGPLDAETSCRWERAMGHAPVEVFGSTETGGVAWRVQGLRGSDAWRLFDQVSIQYEGPDAQLRVFSPFVSCEDESAGFLMGDRAKRIEERRFQLLGRADRVLKIGEKRLSLPDMEASLVAHPWVAEVALLDLDWNGERRIAAVVVLEEAGRLVLAEHGRRSMSQQLSAVLAEEWARVLLPRAWRFVDRLPENALGKVTLESLRALFHVTDEAGK